MRFPVLGLLVLVVPVLAFAVPPRALAAQSATQPARPDVMALIRADQWSEAEAAAAEHADPVVGKLVTYFRLLAPGAASAREIGRFMTENADWPLQYLLARRRDEALAAEADDAAARA
ncbi:MAG: lytic transglycosylase, partial [Rhodospirillales bacterium]|nr:lytic transglycosylase [Rhodospirillales bacterium]